MKVAAASLRPGQTIWLNPGHAGVPRTVELVQPYPNDLDVSILFVPSGDLPRSQLRAPRGYSFDLVSEPQS